MNGEGFLINAMPNRGAAKLPGERELMKLIDLSNIVETKGVFSDIVLCDADSEQELVKGHQMYVSDDPGRDFSRYSQWRVVSIYPQGGHLYINVRK